MAIIRLRKKVKPIENLINYLFLYSISSIWIMIIINTVLVIAGIIYHKRYKLKDLDIEYPLVSIIVPAFNEEAVIEECVKSLRQLDYPNHEIIIVNDNSSDNTGSVLERYKAYIKVITTKGINANLGKSNALNIALKHAHGDIISIYDADNTPSKDSLKYLVAELLSNDEYAAVTGKFTNRNKRYNLLTKFVELEASAFQLSNQGGMQILFKKSSIPGTNYVIWKDALLKAGKYDLDCLVEDTDLSLKLFQMGYKIGFNPLAISYQESPATIKNWFFQRLRWTKGNIYVTVKYLKQLSKCKNIIFDIIYLTGTYLIFLSSVIISDLIFTFLLFIDYQISLNINLVGFWLLAYILFIFQNAVVLLFEDEGVSNIFWVCLSYFSYSQLFIIVVVKSYVNYYFDWINQNEVRWYKTERF